MSPDNDKERYDAFAGAFIQRKQAEGLAKALRDPKADVDTRQSAREYAMHHSLTIEGNEALRDEGVRNEVETNDALIERFLHGAVTYHTVASTNIFDDNRGAIILGAPEDKLVEHYLELTPTKDESGASDAETHNKRVGLHSNVLELNQLLRDHQDPEKRVGHADLITSVKEYVEEKTKKIIDEDLKVRGDEAVYKIALSNNMQTLALSERAAQIRVHLYANDKKEELDGVLGSDSGKATYTRRNLTHLNASLFCIRDSGDKNDKHT